LLIVVILQRYTVWSCLPDYTGLLETRIVNIRQFRARITHPCLFGGHPDFTLPPGDPCSQQRLCCRLFISKRLMCLLQLPV